MELGNSKYYMWIKNSDLEVQIEASNPESIEDDIIITSIDKWQSENFKTPSGELNQLNEIDTYYSLALDNLRQLAWEDHHYRYELAYNSIVWDHRSAKRLFNLAMEKYNPAFESSLIAYSPAYNQYWQLMYNLYYQYFHSNAFKGLKDSEIKSKIETDFPKPESKFLVFHHFFKYGLPLVTLEEHYQLFKNQLNPKEKELAKLIIQHQKIKDQTFEAKLDFIFGIDIDGAMEGFIARDSSQKHYILVFWSIWNKDMAHEFNLLANLKYNYNDQFNFVHIAIDAYESPEKAKAFLYKNRVGGYHLLPEQSNAFRKSIYRKEYKTMDLPYYLILDKDGKSINSESIPLVVSNRLEEKLKDISTKK
jgi:hypothetical protein